MSRIAKYAAFFLFVLGLCSGCKENFFSTTLEDDLPGDQLQMAVHAFLTDGDSLVLASVTRTYGPLEDQPDNELLNDATVEIFEQSNFLLNLEQEDVGFPPLNYIGALPQALNGQGKVYELVVRHPEFGEARATQRIPMAVPLTSATFKEKLGVDDGGERINGVTIRLDDPAGIDNYYEVAVYARNPNTNQGRRLYIETRDPSLVGGYEGWRTGGSSLLIDGTTFDGQSVSFDILGYNMDTTNQELVINWRNLSREMYRYSRTLFLVNDQAIEDNPFASPVSVFSNVEGGLGVFGGRTETLVEVD